MFEILLSLDIKDAVRIVAEIIILTIIFYRVYSALSGTRATEALGVCIGVVVLYFLSIALSLVVIKKMIELFAVPFVMLLGVIYHAEIRRIFSPSFSRKSRFFGLGEQVGQREIDTILNACNILVEKRRGALIFFPRHSDIQSILETGTKLDAELTSSLILTVFDHDTPLHDGAMAIIGDRIAWASCYLPLSEQREIKSSFGTRHRAALGLSEVSDAVVLVVSEENGAMSLSYNANIYYDLSEKTIKRTLRSLLSFNDNFLLEEEKDEEQR